MSTTTPDARVPPLAATLADAQRLCDGTDDIVLRVRVDGTHDLGASEGFFVEDGAAYVYVNGKCQFWEWGYDGDGFNDSDMMRHIWTGTLSPEELLGWMKVLHWNEWSRLDGDFFPGDAFGGDAFLSPGTRNGGFTFSLKYVGPERPLFQKISKGFDQMRKGVFDQASPEPPGPLRVYVEDMDGWSRQRPPLLAGDWPAQMPISAADLSKWQNPYCFGLSMLVTGEPADELRALRDQLAATSQGAYYHYALAVVDADGNISAAWLRETLPFENEYGLVGTSPYCFLRR